jgi:hypothetical protein
MTGKNMKTVDKSEVKIEFSEPLTYAYYQDQLYIAANSVAYEACVSKIYEARFEDIEVESKVFIPIYEKPLCNVYKYKDLEVKAVAGSWETVATIYYKNQITNLEYLGYWLPYVESSLAFVEFPYADKADTFDTYWTNIIDDDYWHPTASAKTIKPDYLSPVTPLLVQVDELMRSWGFSQWNS